MKKTLRALLIALAIVPCVAVFAACGASTDANTSTNTGRSGTYGLSSIRIDGTAVVLPEDVTQISRYQVNSKKPSEIAKPETVLTMPLVQKPYGYPNIKTPHVDAPQELLDAYQAQESWLAFEENQAKWSEYEERCKRIQQWEEDKKAYSDYVDFVNSLIDSGFIYETAADIADLFPALRFLNSVKIILNDDTALIALPSMLSYVNAGYKLVDDTMVFDVKKLILGDIESLSELDNPELSVKYTDESIVISMVSDLNVELTFKK